MIAMPPTTQLTPRNETKYEPDYGDVWYWWRNLRYLAREQMAAGLLVLAAIVAVMALLYITATRTYKSEASFVVDQSPFEFAAHQNDMESSRLLLQSIISSVISFDMREIIAQRLQVPPENICMVGSGTRKLGLHHKNEVNISVDAEKLGRVATIQAVSSDPAFAAAAANAVLDEISSLNRLGGRLESVNQQIQTAQAEVTQYAQNISTADAGRGQLEQEVLGINRHLQSGGSLETAPAFGQDQQLLDLQKKRIDADSAYSAQTQVSVQGPQLRALAGAKQNVGDQVSEYLHNKVIGVRSSLDDATARLAALKAGLAQQMTVLNALQREKTQLSNAVGDFKLRRQLGLFNADQAASEAGVIVVFDRARAAWKPSSPQLGLFIAGGLALALLLCPAVMFFRHNMDRTIKYPQQVELACGVPCLAVMPKPSRSEKRAYLPGKDTGLAFLRNRLLRGNAMGYDNHIVSFMDLGSSSESSTAVAQLGWLLASAGRNTLVVDLDFNRPQLGSLLGASPEQGLADWINSSQPLGSFIQATEVPNLGLLQPGKNLNDVQLSRRHLAQELANLRSTWDYILIYAPSLLENPHLLLAAPGDSPVISLIEHGRASLDDLNEAVALAESFHLRFAGVILHHFPANRAKGSMFGLGPHRYVLAETV